MKTSPASPALSREVGVLGEKAVAGMDRLSASGFSRRAITLAADR